MTERRGGAGATPHRGSILGSFEHRYDACGRPGDGPRLVEIAVDLALGDHMGAESVEQAGVRRLRIAPEAVDILLIRETFEIEEGVAQHLDRRMEPQGGKRSAGLFTIMPREARHNWARLPPSMKSTRPSTPRSTARRRVTA